MVNIIKQELTTLQEEILRILYIKAGSNLNQNRIAKHLEVSSPAVMKALPLLEKKNLIKIEQDKESKRWSIQLNRENHKTLELKRADNLKQTYQSGLAEHLENQHPGTTIILFGSYSRGDDTTNSDIDIAIIGSKEKNVNLEKYEKMLGRKIIINYYDSLKTTHKNLKENLCNGIILAGSVEL